MRVYRGPSSKPFEDDSHVPVDQVKPEELEKGIRSNAFIRFDINKDAYERQAVCTIQFEEADMIPMISGLLSRLANQQECLAKIRAILGDKATDKDQKIDAIKAVLKTK